jgi:hypothetical protein
LLTTKTCTSVRHHENPIQTRIDREQFYLDLIQKCLVSREERKAGLCLAAVAGICLAMAPTRPLPSTTKSISHIDQLTSFLYSAETTRFCVNLGAAMPEDRAHQGSGVHPSTQR